MACGAAQATHSGPSEQQEGNDRRDRIARQPEHERLALPAAPVACPEPGRLSGTQRDAPEHLLRTGGTQRRANVVVRADRHAAADDRDVALKRLHNGRLGRRLLVTDALHPDYLGARKPSERGHGVRVRVAHASGTQLLAWIEQLVARRPYPYAPA